MFILRVEDPQAVQNDVRLQMEIPTTVGLHNGGHAPGEDGADRSPQLFLQPLNDPVQHGGGADDGAGAHAVHGVLAQQPGFPVQVDVGELGSLSRDLFTAVLGRGENLLLMGPDPANPENESLTRLSTADGSREELERLNEMLDLLGE